MKRVSSQWAVLRPHRFKTVGVRISATCWLVTLMTLGLYVLMTLPQQKQDLFDALQSKAQGVSSSLQEVTASAAVSEDYSTVVDQCVQILQGDQAIEYLVITKSDGFSVIVQRSGWRIATLDQFWHPSGSAPISEITYVSLAGKRVFRYARPFEYSALRWGWVNVGLSTAAYDRSVASVQHRSALLAVISAALSLLISWMQSSRLVRPILKLQSVVGQLAKGDLSARANIHSGDEVEDLARSFNLMGDTISARNRILESVRFAGQRLLSADDWAAVVDEVLAKVGQAAEVSRAYLFENSVVDGVIVSSERFEWVAEGIPSNRERWQNFRWQGSGLENWAVRMEDGQLMFTTFPADTAQHSAAHRRILSIDSSLRSLVCAPILTADTCWGFVGFDECVRSREWGEAEKHSFQAIADMFGAAITRQRAQRALLEANENLEHRVSERTHELQEQVRAKQEAFAQLADAQQRLMTLSRQAGMAEVATGVLHNVGNVLNSVNVSATIVANKVRDSHLASLLTLSEMLNQHQSDLSAFLGRDPKGQRVLPYLSKLSVHLESERHVMLQELEQLTEHVGHIKEIVATQQAYAKVSGVIEIISPRELVENALRVAAPGLERHRIRLERDYQNIPDISADKHSILQILLNLLNNAKRAIADASAPEAAIVVGIARCDEERIRIWVSDTGVGLPPENLTRIFSHGFTTRRDGHGFGLHSGANAARSMGGALWAESKGVGQGATFILELPINANETAKAAANENRKG